MIEKKEKDDTDVAESGFLFLSVTGGQHAYEQYGIPRPGHGLMSKQLVPRQNA